jgi:nicotinate-nucleotide pyrophosphorylase (carboxylating)
MKNVLKSNDVDDIIDLALKEDVGSGDITTDAIFNPEEKSVAEIIAKESGIFCGGEIAKKVYNIVDPSLKISLIIKDGKKIRTGDTAVKVSGCTKSILIGERTCMNFLQRMSGIATKTSGIVAALKGTGITVLDTRKTAPGLRLIDKYSVKCGGGRNHRIGLFDMVLIKDNHIMASGSITEAVSRIINVYGSKYKIEVETSNIDEVNEALNTAADIIMLDNMDKHAIKEAVKIIKKRKKIEISGNFDEQRLNEISDLKIDYVSIGALTHSVKAFDFSMKFR